MVGVISAVNPDRQRAAIARVDGTYSVIVYQSPWDIAVGQKVAGLIAERGLAALSLADGGTAQVIVEAVFQTSEEAHLLVNRVT